MYAATAGVVSEGTSVAGDDEGFGPVERGRGSRLRRAAPLAPPAPPSRAPRERTRVYERPPEADDYAPLQRGRGGGRDGGGGRDDGGRRGGHQPQTRERPPPRRRGGGGRVLVILLLLALLVPLGMGLAAAAWASSQIDRIAVDGLSSAGGTMNILVIGSDSREDLTPEEAAELGTGTVGGKRTDTIFVLSVRGGQAALLSFPRDLFVTRCDGSQGRINAAFATENGPSCIAQTVAQVSGVPITHYLELSFLSVVRIVDALGGVTVELEAPISDASANIDLPAGEQTLTPEQALGFVRVRKIDDDFGRIGRQQYFIQQLARQAASPRTLSNPLTALRTAGAVGNALIADEGFGTIDLLRLAWGGRTIATGQMPSYTVPATPQSIGGAAVLVADDAQAAPLYEAFRSGTVFTDPPPAQEG
ncbi:LCP family protein [soil metagenome]